MQFKALMLAVLLMAAIIISGCTTPQQGAQGPSGQQGPQGERGPSGISGYEIVAKENTNVVTVIPGGALAVSGVTAECPVGKKIIGGGCDGPHGNIMEDGKPWEDKAASRYGWTCFLSNPKNPSPQSNYPVTAYAICAIVN